MRLELNLDYIEAGAANSLLLIVGATFLLLTVCVLLSGIYFQYVVSFPANLLAFALSNIRKGEIDTCPEPESNHELSAAIRQYNATAEFLAQNTFLNQLSTRAPSSAISLQAQRPAGRHNPAGYQHGELPVPCLDAARRDAL